MLEHSCSSGGLATFEANSSDDSGGVFMNSRGTQALTPLRFIDKTLPWSAEGFYERVICRPAQIVDLFYLRGY